MRRFLALLLTLSMSFDILVPVVAVDSETGPESNSSVMTQDAEEEGIAEQQTTVESEPEVEPEANPEEEPEPADTAEVVEAEPENYPREDSRTEEPEADSPAEDGALENELDPETAKGKNPEEEGAAVPSVNTIQAVLNGADGVRYAVTVSYDEFAQIPEGSTLSITELNQELTDEEKKLPENQERPYESEHFLSEQDLAQETFDLHQGIKVQESDYVLFTKFLDISLVSGGKSIQPKAPVTVTIETDAVEEGASDALIAALYDEEATEAWQETREKLVKEQEQDIKSGKLKREDARQFEEKIYTALELVNKTEKDRGTAITFETEKLTRLGITAVAKELKSWTVKDTVVSVYGPQGLDAKINTERMKAPEAGVESVRAFSVETKGNESADYDVTYWVGTDARNAEPETPASADSGVVVSEVKNSQADNELIGIEGTDEPVAIQEGDTIGVAYDTGLREQTIEEENVTLEGMLPKRAKVTVNDMLWRYSHPDILRDEVNEGEAVTVAAYDITIINRGDEFQPEDGESVNVSISGEGIDKEKRLEVWHLLDDGSVEVIRDFTVEGDAISFDAEGFSVYMVVEYTVDFHWGEYTYNLQGGSTLLLSELLTILAENGEKFQASGGKETGLPAEDTTYNMSNGSTTVYDSTKLAELAQDMDQIEKVEFSNPELVKVEKQASGDWLLTSLEAFDTDETLTITLANGETITIHVTDAQQVSYKGFKYTVNGSGASAAATLSSRVSNTGAVLTGFVPVGGNYAPVTSIPYNVFGPNKEALFSIGKDENNQDGIVDRIFDNVTVPELITWDSITGNTLSVKTWDSGTEKWTDSTDVKTIMDSAQPGNKNHDADSKSKMWKQTNFNETTGNLEITLNYFEDQGRPIDFIFVSDETGTMYTNSATATTHDGKTLTAPRFVWGRSAMIKAVQALLEANTTKGYDNQVSFVVWDHNARNKSGWYGTGQFNDANQWLGKTYTNHGGTNHTEAIQAVLDQISSGRSNAVKVVVYMSDFADGGLAGDLIRYNGERNRARNLLNKYAQVYALDIFNKTENTMSNADYRRMTRYISQQGNNYWADPDDPSMILDAFQEIITDAVSNMDTDKSFKDELSSEIQTQAGKADLTWDLNGGTSTVDIDGESVTVVTPLKTGTLYRKTFTIPINGGDKVYSGNMPTNGDAMVLQDGNGEPLNSIAAANSPVLKMPVQFVLGCQGSTDLIDGIHFTLQKIDASGNPVGTAQTFVTGSAGTGEFHVSYDSTGTSGNGFKFDAGDRYLLTENSDDVDTYNGTDPTHKLFAPGNSWILIVRDDYTITSAVQGEPVHTSNLTVSEGKLRIWNEEKIEAKLIPITVKKVWSGNGPKYDVPFTLYGVDPDDSSNTLALNVYNSDDESAAVEVTKLTADNSTVTTEGENTIWTKTVYVYDKIGDQKFSEYVKVPVVSTGHTYSQDMTGKEYFYANQTYHYEIEEHALPENYRFGYYVQGTSSTTSSTTVTDAYEESAAGHYDTVTNTKNAQMHLYINYFQLNDDITYGNTTDYRKHNNNRMYNPNNLYKHLNSVELTVRDSKTNKTYFITFDTGNINTNQYGRLFQNIKVPKEWVDDYGWHGLLVDAAKNIKNLTITKLTFIDDQGNRIDLEGGNNNLEHGPDFGLNNSIYRLAIEINGANAGTAHPATTVSNCVTKVWVPTAATPKTDTYSINELTLTMTNTEIPLQPVTVRKEWKNTPPEQEQSVAFDITGEYASGGSVVLPVYDDANRGTEPNPLNQVTLTSANAVSDDVWEKTVYIPEYAQASNDLRSVTSASGSYNVIERALTVTPDPDVQGSPGYWKDAVTDYTYTEGQEAIPGGTMVTHEAVDAHWEAYTPASIPTPNPNLIIDIKPRPNLRTRNYGIQNLGQLRVTYTKDGTTYRDTVRLNRNSSLTNNTLIGGLLLQGIKSYYTSIALPFAVDSINVTKIELSNLNGSSWVELSYDSGVGGWNNTSSLEPLYRVRLASDSASNRLTSVSTGYEKWIPYQPETTVTLPDTPAVPPSSVYTVTNEFKANTIATIQSKFADETGDAASTGQIKSAQYTITKSGSGETTSVNVPLTNKNGEAKVYLPDGDFTIVQNSYTLEGATGSADDDVVVDQNNAFTLTIGKEKAEGDDEGNALYDDITSSGAFSVDGSSMTVVPPTILFTNTRKDYPVYVQMDWQGAVDLTDAHDDPFNGNNPGFTLLLAQTAADPAVSRSGEIIYKNTDSSVTDSAGPVAVNAMPAYDVYGVPVQITISGDGMDERLPDFTVENNVVETEVNGHAAMVHTFVCTQKKASVYVSKFWDTENEFPESVSFTLTKVKYTDGVASTPESIWSGTLTASGQWEAESPTTYTVSKSYLSDDYAEYYVLTETQQTGFKAPDYSCTTPAGGSLEVKDGAAWFKLTSEGAGIVITNSEQMTSFTIKKVWKDSNGNALDSAIYADKSVEVKLKGVRATGAGGPVIENGVPIATGITWPTTWADFPKAGDSSTWHGYSNYQEALNQYHVTMEPTRGFFKYGSDYYVIKQKIDNRDGNAVADGPEDTDVQNEVVKFSGRVFTKANFPYENQTQGRIYKGDVCHDEDSGKYYIYWHYQDGGALDTPPGSSGNWYHIDLGENSTTPVTNDSINIAYTAQEDSGSGESQVSGAENVQSDLSSTLGASNLEFKDFGTYYLSQDDLQSDGSWSTVVDDLPSAYIYYAIETAVDGEPLSSSGDNPTKRFHPAYNFVQQTDTVPGSVTITNHFDPIARVIREYGTGSNKVQLITYHDYLINPDNNTYDVDPGAFNYAQKQSGKVIIETLKKGDVNGIDDTKFPGDTVGRYTLQESFTLDDTNLSDLTLRTIPNAGFKSTIKRGYTKNDEDSLIKIQNINMTISNIVFDGNRDNNWKGRAVEIGDTSSSTNVKYGTLTITDGAQFRNFNTIQRTYASNAASDAFDAKGGVINCNQGTTLTITGSASKPVVFERNTLTNTNNTNKKGADGGAIYATKNCTVQIAHAEFRNNSVTSNNNTSKGNGGAVALGDTSKEATKTATLTISNTLFDTNTAQYNGGAVRVTENSNVSLTECTFTDNTATNGDGGAVVIHSNANDANGNKVSRLTIDGAEFSDNTAGNNGGAINIGPSAIATESGLVIDGHSDLTLNGKTDAQLKTEAGNAPANAVNGGGIYVSANASFTFTGGELTKCKASGNGGAIYNAGTLIMAENQETGTHVLTNGSLEYCSASNGGAIYNAAGGTVDMTGGYLEHCFASGNGGGIYTESTATQTVGGKTKGAVNLHTEDKKPGVISDCSASNGGGIYLAAGELDLTGGTIQNCEAIKKSGDNVTNVVLGINDGNKTCASGNGGGIFNEGKLIISGTGTTGNLSDNIVSCTADVHGGGIFVDKTGEMDITGGTIQDCRAGYHGGAIYDNTTSTLTLTDLTIKGHVNTSTMPASTKNAQKGGGIYVADGELDVTGGGIYDCTAEQGGAIYHIFNQHEKLNNSATAKNTKLVLTNVLIDGHDKLTDGTVANADNGGAIYVYNGCNDQNTGHSGHNGTNYTPNKLSQYPGPKIEINGGKILDCTAKVSGGAIYCDSPVSSGSNTILIQKGAIINGHESLASDVWNAKCDTTESEVNQGGGAIYFKRGTLLIDGSESQVKILNCTAAKYGGAIYGLPAGTTTDEEGDKYTASLKNVLIDGHSSADGDSTTFAAAAAQPNAGSGGGAICMKMSILTVENCTFQKLRAPVGAAIYARTNDSGTGAATVNIKGGTISGNAATDANGGAVNIPSGSAIPGLTAASNNWKAAKINLEDSVVIYDNFGTGTYADQQKNLVLQLFKAESNAAENNNNTIINVTNTGLNANAHIGVYVVGDADNAANGPYKFHGQYLQDFATYQGSDASKLNLRCFTNDRNGLYGELCPDHTSNMLIRWQSYLCKLTDKDGNLLYQDADHKIPAVYDRLMTKDTVKGGFSAASSGTLYTKSGDEYSNTADIKVEMLKNYTMPSDDAVTNNANRNVTYKTANANASQNQAGDIFTYWGAAPATMAGWSNTDVRRTKATITRGFSGASMITIKEKAFKVNDLIFDGNSSSYTCNSDGGAIKGDTVNNIAITVENSLFRSFSTSGKGGAIYQKKGDIILDNDTFGELNANGTVKTASACTATGDGGAVYHNTGSIDGISIQNTNFYGCTSGGNGGAYNGSPSKTDMTNVTIKGCSATGDGGGFAVRYGSTTATNVNINGCTAANGGGLAILSSNEPTVTFTSGNEISGCEATSGNGGGVYIGTKGYFNLNGGTISSCTANQNGGGVYTQQGLRIGQNNTGGSITGCEATNGHGGGVYAADYFVFQSGMIYNCKAENGNGGGVYDAATNHFEMDGGSILACKAINGGGIYNVSTVNTNNADGTNRIGSGFTIAECDATGSGGALYLAENSRMHLLGGTITANTSDTDGGGIYLSENSILHIAGGPVFAGSYKDHAGADKTGIGNFKDVDFGTDKTIGGVDYLYDNPRQDIFIKGYIGQNTSGEAKMATSLHIDGSISSGDGSIWVWAEKTDEEDNHYQQLKQFAVFNDQNSGAAWSDTAKSNSAKAFRNAQDDDATGNATETYLFGTLNEDDDTKTYIYWTGVAGYRKVILRKVDGSDYASLAGATFNLYKGNSSSIYTWKDRNDKTKTLVMGEEGTKQNLTSQASGVIWIGELPYGTYYLKETGTPKDAEGITLSAYTGNGNKWFCLIVDETGAYMSAGFKESTESASKTAAKTAAEALKPSTP